MLGWQAGLANALGSEGMGLNTRRYLGPPSFSMSQGLWQECGMLLRALGIQPRRLTPDMNLLMFVAVCGAAVIGEWFEAVTVSFSVFGVTLIGIVECRSG